MSATHQAHTLWSLHSFFLFVFLWSVNHLDEAIICQAADCLCVSKLGKPTQHSHELCANHTHSQLPFAPNWLKDWTTGRQAQCFARQGRRLQRSKLDPTHCSNNSLFVRAMNPDTSILSNARPGAQVPPQLLREHEHPCTKRQQLAAARGIQVTSRHHGGWTF